MSKFVMIGFVAFSIGMALGIGHFVQTPHASASAPPAHDPDCRACVSQAIRDQYDHPQWSRHIPITAGRKEHT